MNDFTIRTQVRKLTEDQSTEHLRRIAQLHAMGIEVGCDRDLLRVPIKREQLRLEQLDPGLACLHAMPGEGFVFVAFLRLTTLASALIIDDCEMTTSWDHLPLELDDPESVLFYRDIVAECHTRSPKILNPWLTGERLLRYGRKDGLLIAKGHESMPSRCLEHSLLNVELSLFDVKGSEFPFTFRAQVSRALKVAYERRQHAMYRRKARVPLFPDGQHDALEQRDPDKPLTPTLGNSSKDEID